MIYMPARTTPLVTNHFYHIMSRGHNSIPIFKRKEDYSLFIDAFCYYQNRQLPLKFSKFRKLSISQKNDILISFQNKKNFWVKIIAYCLMPNHFHFLVKQTKDNGIREFIRLFGNSYARYFNTKYRQKGSLFESRFRAVRIETDSQLLHVSRYIHLNPYSGYVVKNIEALCIYPFSSLPEYFSNTQIICHKQLILGQFSSPTQYKKFILDQADYQRELQNIRHQLLED